MTDKLPTICVLNGSPSGLNGNSAQIVARTLRHLETKAIVHYLALADHPVDHILPLLQASQGFIFVTGTYWDSWGSPLQKFLEDLTSHEGGELWLGKPAAVVVSMHAVGGKSVLSRLQGVLNTLGLVIPPMSGIVLSLVNQLALKASEGEWTEDLWRYEDLEVVCHNLVQSLSQSPCWKTWPKDSDYKRVWAQDL